MKGGLVSGEPSFMPIKRTADYEGTLFIDTVSSLKEGNFGEQLVWWKAVPKLFEYTDPTNQYHASRTIGYTELRVP